MNSVVKVEHSDVNAIPFQEASLDIWDQKYRLSAKDGTPIDPDPWWVQGHQKVQG